MPSHEDSGASNIGDKLFLIHREIIITKVYYHFQLVKIHYLEEHIEFCLDYNVLSVSPNCTKTIDINKF